MKPQLYIMVASLAVTTVGANMLSASPVAAAQYQVDCFGDFALVGYAEPCDGYAAYQACVEASQVCGKSMELTGFSGPPVCLANCKAVN